MSRGGQPKDEARPTNSVARAFLLCLGACAALILAAGCQTAPPPAARGDFRGPPSKGLPSAPSVPVSPPAAAWKSEAARWIGTPYKTGGMTKSGADCSGFTLQVYRAVAGASLPHNSEMQFQLGRPVRATELMPGDLLFFQTGAKPQINHVGIYLGNKQFVHASLSQGVRYSSLTEAYYAQRFRGARRLFR